MTQIIHAIVQFAETYTGLVYAVAFVATCFESVAVIGLLVPGSAIIVALGALVPSGAVGFWWLCLWSILGALVGDGLSYWIGYRHRGWLASLWPFSRHPEVLSQGEKFFAAHGGKSVFLARFVAPVRGTVPLVAGMAFMKPGRFFTVSVLSALGWAPAHILPGALIGAGLTLTGGVATRLLILVIALAAILWLAGKVTMIAVRHSVQAIVVPQQKLDDWAQKHNGWVSRQILALFDPRRGEARAIALLGVVLIAAAWTFFGVLEDVVTGDPLVRADAAIYNMLQGLRVLAADRVMIAITELGSAIVAGALSAAVLIWLLWRRAWSAALYWIAAVGGAAVIGLVIKMALHRPRPVPIYSGWDAFSFPSGHATTNAAIYGFLAILLAREARPAWQAIAAATATLIVMLIGFSRLYLGVHWFSDVAGGIAFGTAWIALLGISYVRHSPPITSRIPLTVTAIAVIVVVGSVDVAHKMPIDLERYATRQTERTMTAVSWWRGGWRDVPSRRIDLVGEREEPLILQWAGRVDELKNRLAAAGWRPSAPWSIETAMRWLSATDNPMVLPVLPRLNDGRDAALTLIHLDVSEAGHPARWVLRIWRAGFRLTIPEGHSVPLWVGALTRQRFDGALAPLGLGFETGKITVPWSVLEKALPPSRRVLFAGDRISFDIMLAHGRELAGLPQTSR